jgi:exosortase A-associated hydrolase 2
VTSRPPAPDPFFLEGTAGPLFALHFAPAGPAQRAVLVLPPFAEELNKSRRLIALAARALQAAGIHVLMIDLYGTGDSGGDFSNATLAIWRDDVRRAAGWLAGRGVTRLDVLAVRGGALLLEDFAPPSTVARGHVVLWQPVTSGRLLIAQFLRLRVAEGMTSDGVSPDVRAQLKSEGRVEVVGYTLSSELVNGLEAITDPLVRSERWEKWHWLEVTAPGVNAPGAAAQRSIAAMRLRGLRVQERAVEGEPFWATPEIAVVPGLVEATVACFAEPAA